MIVHHLSHRRSHTTRDGPLACDIFRTEVVVGCTLSPRRCEQRRDRFLFMRSGTCIYNGTNGYTAAVVLLQPGYLVSVTLQPSTLLVGHVIQIENTCITESQDVEGAVVVADDDKTASFTHTEYVESADLSLQLEL